MSPQHDRAIKRVASGLGFSNSPTAAHSSQNRLGVWFPSKRGCLEAGRAVLEGLFDGDSLNAGSQLYSMAVGFLVQILGILRIDKSCTVGEQDDV